MFIVFRLQTIGAFYLMLLIFSLAAGLAMILHRVNFKMGENSKIDDTEEEEAIVN